MPSKPLPWTTKRRSICQGHESIIRQIKGISWTSCVWDECWKTERSCEEGAGQGRASLHIDPTSSLYGDVFDELLLDATDLSIHKYTIIL